MHPTIIHCTTQKCKIFNSQRINTFRLRNVKLYRKFSEIPGCGCTSQCSEGSAVSPFHSGYNSNNILTRMRTGHWCLSAGREVKLLANSFRIRLMVALSVLLEAVRPVVEVASKAEYKIHQTPVTSIYLSCHGKAFGGFPQKRKKISKLHH